MKNALVVLLVVALVPFVSSCFSTGKSVVKDTGDAVGGTIEGTGKGTLDVVEGTSEGVADLGKGTAEAVVGTAKATGYTLVGHGDEAVESGKEAAKAGGEGIKGVIEKPIEGIGKGLQSIDRSIKKATGREDIK
ncbi:MAG: hypothetical protein WBC74_04525 [Candidatus Omnitrophota bacterium]